MFFRNLFSKKPWSFLKKSSLNLQKLSSKTGLPAVLSLSSKKKLLSYMEKPFSFIKKNQKMVFGILVAFLISDLLLIKSYNTFLPEKELPFIKPSYHLLQTAGSSSEKYRDIWENNIFHTGPIPLKREKESIVSLEPVLSSLPFKLTGTIIHANPRRSVASITAGVKNETLSYQKGDIIDKQAEIKEIKRAKVVFINQNNSRLEYIVIPDKPNKLNISYETKKPDKIKPTSVKSGLVTQTGPNDFQVKRSDINSYLQNLPEILQQAQVVPHRLEKNGEIVGFRFSAIDKGSIFEDLGFKKGDIIKEVDGEAVTTPDKALELFDRLKGSSGFKILVQKEGKDVYYNYGVRENAPMK